MSSTKNMRAIISALDSLGLHNKLPKFVKNKIDDDIVLSVSDSQLEGLGLVIGDCIRFKAAVTSILQKQSYVPDISQNQAVTEVSFVEDVPIVDNETTIELGWAPSSNDSIKLFEMPKVHPGTPPPTPQIQQYRGSSQSPVKVSLSNPTYNFNITELFNSNSRCRDIIRNLNQNRFFTRKERQEICAILIDELLERVGPYPSKHTLAQLAQDLVNTYPFFGDPSCSDNGASIWFYSAPKLPYATGFLEERIKSQRKIFLTRRGNKSKNSAAPVVDEDWASENEDFDPTCEEGKLLFMRFNSGPEVEQVMRETVFERRTIMRNQSWSEIIPAMPRLFDTIGMINQDFGLRHPKKDKCLYKLWPSVSKLLFEYCTKLNPTYLLNIDVPATQLSDDDMALIGYMMLPHLLPFSGRKRASESMEEVSEYDEKTIAPRKRDRTVKIPVRDVTKSMVHIVPDEITLERDVSLNTRDYPFIACVGNLQFLKFQSFKVILGQCSIPCNPVFYHALDTCYKTFKLLKIPFPLECKPCWQFIDYTVFDTKYAPHEISPGAHALAGQIKYRMTTNSKLKTGD